MNANFVAYLLGVALKFHLNFTTKTITILITVLKIW